MAKKFTRKGRKTRSAGRFGVRYGTKNRKLVADIEERMRQGYKCPKCGQITVRRTDTGIWNCKKCNHTYSGGTYVPRTSVGLVAARSIKKAIEPDMYKELEEPAPEDIPAETNEVQADTEEVPTETAGEAETSVAEPEVAAREDVSPDISEEEEAVLEPDEDIL